MARARSGGPQSLYRSEWLLPFSDRKGELDREPIRLGADIDRRGFRRFDGLDRDAGRRGQAGARHSANSFALVEAGAPGVAVLEDNRLVGKTDSSGQLLLTGLRGFENNKISIDPTTLPLSAQTGMTETTLRPRGRSGVLADFKVAVDARDAEIILTDASGAPLPPGGRVEYSGGSPSVIGYDGRTYLGGLAPQNVVRVHSEGKTCTAAFDYHAATGAARPTIGPIPCRVDPSDVKDRVTADPKRLRR